MQRKCVIQDRNRDLYIVNVAPPLQAKGKEPEFRSICVCVYIYMYTYIHTYKYIHMYNTLARSRSSGLSASGCTHNSRRVMASDCTQPAATAARLNLLNS